MTDSNIGPTKAALAQPADDDAVRAWMEAAGWTCDNTKLGGQVRVWRKGGYAAMLDHDADALYAHEQAAYALVIAATEKAYGGCHNCYGKGYATVNNRWIGHDTDQDIGSPGGTITGGNPMAMKFCTCERGKQLERMVSAARLRGEDNHDQ